MQHIFTDIYAQNKWHGGSGPGSRPEFCQPLVHFITDYVATHHITTFCDLGCGDLQWVPGLLQQTNVTYTGLDCVEDLIRRHIQTYRGTKHKFACRDISALDTTTLPQADLYFMKDILQHWPSKNVVTFLQRVLAARPDGHWLVVNCHHQTSDERVLDANYTFAPLHGDYYPLSLFHPQPLFAWGGKTLYRLTAPLPLPSSL
jgi:hypothetical protein